MTNEKINSVDWKRPLKVKAGSVVKYNGGYYKSLNGVNKSEPEGNPDYLYLGELKQNGNFAFVDASNLSNEQAQAWRDLLGVPDIGPVYRVKGSVADMAALEALTNMEEGDVYNLLDTGMNYVYVLDLNDTGEPGWDSFGSAITGDFVPMDGVADNRSITGNLVIGNKSFSEPITNPSEYKSLIKDGYYFNQGVESPSDNVFQSSSNFYVNGSGLNYKKVDPSPTSSSINQVSNLTLNDYGIALNKTFYNGVFNEYSVNINQYSLELSAYRGVNNPEIYSRYLSGFSLDAITQKATLIFGNPEVIHPEVRFRKFEFDENGFKADTDYSSESNPLAFVQKKYVDNKIAELTALKPINTLTVPVTNGSAYYVIIGNLVYVTCEFDVSLQVDETISIALPNILKDTLRVCHAFNSSLYGSPLVLKTDLNGLQFINKSDYEMSGGKVKDTFIFEYVDPTAD